MGIKCIACNKPLLSIIDKCQCSKKKIKWRENDKHQTKLIKDWNEFIENNVIIT